jgi:murein DD-endopeptidase MepM/ murein hydrolase activator NlpD
MDDSKDPGPSFDPRTWAVGPARGSAPAEGLQPQAGAPRRGPGRRIVVGALALGGAIGGAWILTRANRAARPTPPALGSGRRSLVIAGSGELAAALVGAGVANSVAQAAARAALPALGGRDELRVFVQLGPGAPPPLLLLEARRADGTGVRVRPTAVGGFLAEPLSADLTSRVRVVRGEMDATSFYSSAVAAGVTDTLISDFAAAFAFDFDFQREIRPGDIFEAAFAQHVNEAGDSVGAEQLLYAALQTAAKSRALYSFTAAREAKPGWFDGGGVSVARSLMRTPVDGARVSSTFGMRFHPILGYTRMHKGIDFATPVGTPVFASGDGAVDFVGVHDGHGNYVRIRHNPTLETAYAHLSAYAPGLMVGAPVRQGQQIALSGDSGLATGPHLHYEVIVGGEQVDPMTFQTQVGRRLTGAMLASFVGVRDRIDALRAAQHG